LKDSYDLWLSRVCESEKTRSRYLQNIKQFETWAKNDHDMAVHAIPTRWREAKNFYGLSEIYRQATNLDNIDFSS